MSNYEIVLYIYLGVAGISALFLARKYWLEWRATPSKYNIYFKQKQANRIVDSYVFIIAYVVYVIVFPLAIVDECIKSFKKRGKV